MMPLPRRPLVIFSRGVHSLDADKLGTFVCLAATTALLLRPILRQGSKCTSRSVKERAFGAGASLKGSSDVAHLNALFSPVSFVYISYTCVCS